MSTGSKDNFSQLQHLLKLSYSDNPEDLQKAAIELARLVEGTVFPAVSFGPISHALCRLIPNNNRTVASYSARAIKLLLLDDSLRPQAISAGVPAILCAAIGTWGDEVLCLRELLGALQTLCWDKACVRAVLHTNIVPAIVEYTQTSDQEVAVLAMAVLANILFYSDTLLLTDNVTLESLGTGLPSLLSSLKSSQFKPQIFYAGAALANASSNPRLAEIVKAHNGLIIFREMERQSSSNLHILGSRMGDCAQSALYKLSDRKEGEPKAGAMKFRFKWGVRPVMGITLASFQKHRGVIAACFVIWLVVVFYTFSPLVYS